VFYIFVVEIDKKGSEKIMLLDELDVNVITVDGSQILLIYFDVDNGNITRIGPAEGAELPQENEGVIGWGESLGVEDKVFFFEAKKGKLFCFDSYSVNGITDSSEMLKNKGLKGKILNKTIAFLCPAGGEGHWSKKRE